MFGKSSKAGQFRAIYKPVVSVSSAASNGILNTRTPSFASSNFARFGNVTHHSTDWQISTDNTFTSIVYQSLTNTTNTLSITSSEMTTSNTLYVRCRYKTNGAIVSLYSDPVSFVCPFATGSNMSVTNSTNVDVNSSTTVSLFSGSYRIQIWGGGGYSSAGGCVSKDVVYNTTSTVLITVGTSGRNGQGSCHNNSCDAAPGGSPGGGNGADYGDWRNGSGGGYSNTLGMTAGGGGGGGHGNGPTAGGQDPSLGSNSGSGFGGAGNGAGGGDGNQGPGSGSGGSGGGGGGGGAHRSGGSGPASDQSGNGGQNSGSYTSSYPGSFGTPGNSYSSSTYGRTFGSNTSQGGCRIIKL